MSVAINGANFTGTTSVKFNTTSTTFTVNSSVKITAPMPAGATTTRFDATIKETTATTSCAVTLS